MLSERARCSVDNLQYHFALEDAQQILQRRPDSWLGHVRLAEVYFATFNFEQAAASYQTAFQVQYSILEYAFVVTESEPKIIVNILHVLVICDRSILRIL